MRETLTTDEIKILIPVILGFLFAVLYLIETFVYSIREAGRSYGVIAMGYSLSTQFGTLARMSTALAMPIVGYLLDNNISVHSIIIIPLTTAVIYCAVMLLVISCTDRFLLFVDLFFRWYILKMYKIKSDKVSEKNSLSLSSPEKVRFVFISSFASFFVVVVGIFISFILASVYHDHRAMIMQSTVLVTSIGTLISVLVFDPMISSVLDRGGDYRFLLRIIFISRSAAMLLMGLLLLLAYKIAL